MPRHGKRQDAPATLHPRNVTGTTKPEDPRPPGPGSWAEVVLCFATAASKPGLLKQEFSAHRGLPPTVRVRGPYTRAYLRSTVLSRANRVFLTHTASLGPARTRTRYANPSGSPRNKQNAGEPLNASRATDATLQRRRYLIVACRKSRGNLPCRLVLLLSSSPCCRADHLANENGCPKAAVSVTGQ